MFASLQGSIFPYCVSRDPVSRNSGSLRNGIENSGIENRLGQARKSPALFSFICFLVAFYATLSAGANVTAQDNTAQDNTVQDKSGQGVKREDYFVQKIKPLLVEYCYDCHGDGESEGDFELDKLATPGRIAEHPDIWWKVLKNIRAGVMPPNDSAQLSKTELDLLTQWIKFDPLQIDPENLDPGPVAIRRLNRQEYGNTIRELMGIPFNEKLLFPPDDSGHGFDNVADALTFSPLLLDKYFQAAEIVVDRAVPKVTRIVPRQVFRGSDFRGNDFRGNGSRGRGSFASGRSMDGKRAATVAKSFSLDDEGVYDVQINIRQHGSFEFDPARYQVTCQIDGKEKFSVELGWDEHKRTQFSYAEKFSAGKHRIEFALKPIVNKDSAELMEDRNGTHVRFEISNVSIEGPRGTKKRVHPPNYDRFFPLEDPPSERRKRRDYAARVLREFTTKAFRGRAKESTVERLVSIAEAAYVKPEVTFEQGIGKAMVAVLASPRFLFRIESLDDSTLAEKSPNYGQIGELSLASRLSYFLWSSMPDEELFQLAKAGKLRSQLPRQIDRMLASRKADELVSNFVGQWLRTRDVETMAIDPAVVLGYADELNDLRQWFRSRFRRGSRNGSERSPEDQKKIDRFREIRAIVDRVDGELKRSMRDETEKFVEYVIRRDRNLLDLLDSDYTFLNEKLARHYGIDGVQGQRMRRVSLSKDSVRGGLLTQASMLLVTSNPTRTSPVKRGLFILDNILGTPAPPAPAVVPELEASAEHLPGDKKPTLRELLAVHRKDALCASCHARMDPLGLALENFDALGMWRKTDQGVPVQTAGQLVTGEKFSDVKELKQILRKNHYDKFYRCVAEKLLTFAIGRGIEYTDEHTLDLLVEQLQENDGKFSSLLKAVVDSAPFQKQRVGNGKSKKQ